MAGCGRGRCVAAVRPFRASLRPGIPYRLAADRAPDGPCCSPARPPLRTGCSPHRAAASHGRGAAGPGPPGEVAAPPWRQHAAGGLRTGLREVPQVLPAAAWRAALDVTVGDTSRLTPEVKADFRAAAQSPAGGVRGESTSDRCVVRPHSLAQSEVAGSRERSRVRSRSGAVSNGPGGSAPGVCWDLDRPSTSAAVSRSEWFSSCSRNDHLRPEAGLVT